MRSGRTRRLGVRPRCGCCFLRPDRQVRRASFRRRDWHPGVRFHHLQGQVARTHPSHRRRDPGLVQGARLRVVGAHRGGDRQLLRGFQRPGEQKTHRFRGHQGPHRQHWQPVCSHHHHRLHGLCASGRCEGGQPFRRVLRGLQDQPCREAQPHSFRPVVLRLQRARDHDHEEDQRRHPVRRQHRQARYRYCRRGYRDGRVA
mmetsp:Transcript_636/g.1329  ORF Transcript_636/g.1329 Transcript_636/m.1329 type:complete len:201 (-) Transcript_636:100-702(-)